MSRKPNVAFICQDNTYYSQLAERLAKWYGDDVIESYSAGVVAGEALSSEAIDAMQSIYEVDLSTQSTKSWEDIPPVDIIISLTNELPEGLTAQYFESWEMNGESAPETIDYLAEKIRYLIDLIIRGRYPIENED